MVNWGKFLNHLLRSNRRKSANRRKPANAEPSGKHPQNQTRLSDKLNENLQLLQNIYADCSDVIFHDFWIAGKTNAVLIYIDGLIHVDEVDQHVLAPLQQDFALEHTLPNIRKKIAVSSVKPVRTVTDAVEEISGGNPVLIMEGENQGLSIGLSKWEKRSIEEPTAESVLRGPREGFIESLRTNTSMLRRKLRTPKLKIKAMNIGTYSKTPVAVAYIEGIAAPALVEEMMSRLRRIEIDGILESAYIEELIEDNPYSPFPQLLSTERPDVASAYLLEGHVAVLVDGTPSVLIAPVTFFSLLQSPEDYYERYVVGTAIRWLRFLFFGISLLGPSLYVAILSFHQEMIPALPFINDGQVARTGAVSRPCGGPPDGDHV